MRDRGDAGRNNPQWTETTVQNGGYFVWPASSRYARGRGPGPLAFGNARLTDRRAGRRRLFCREECKQRDSNHSKDHNVLGLSFLCIPCATACADMIVIVNPWARLDHAP